MNGLQPPYRVKINITDRNGRQMELTANFISGIGLTHEIERESQYSNHYSNHDIRITPRISKRFTLSFNGDGDLLAQCGGNETNDDVLSIDMWEKMILNGIHNDDK